MAGLGAANGGSFPSEWGLATLGFGLVVATLVLVADLPLPGPRGLAFLAGLASLAAWAALSALWSPGAAAPVLEAERGLLYVTAAAAALLLVSLRGGGAALLGGVVAGAVTLSLYALATRLFPGHVGGAYDPSSGYQLAEPVGYWNAFGILVAVATLLALGFAAHGMLPTRAAAAIGLVVLLPTLYFTFSRGALVALAVGGAVQAAVDPRRARLLACGGLLAVPGLLAVEEASRRHALTAPGATLQTAQAEGRDLAWTLVAIGALAAAGALAVHLTERRIRLPAAAGRVLVTTTAVVGALAAVVLVVALAGRATSALSAELPAGGGDLNRRLLSTSGNGRSDYWRVAWEMVRDEPLLGTGAGGFEASWLRERPVSFHARDAHNLYLETLAELGPLGLALLLATLALPLAAVRRGRLVALGPAAAGALTAVLVHAGVDWDWEVPAVTLPALFCAAVLLQAHGPAGAPIAGRRRTAVLGLLAPVLAAALVAHVGNRAAAASLDAAAEDDPAEALAAARRAIRWAPWSEEPWQLRGEAELLLGHDADARRSFRRALELNPESWIAWLDLAVASDGAQRARALDRVTRLNPLSPEAEELRTES